VSVYLKREPFDVLIARAGLTYAEFAQKYARLSPVTLSHARNGRPLRPSTLRAIALGLTRIKPMKGLDGVELVSATPPEKEKTVAAGTPPRSREVSRERHNPRRS